MDILQQLKFTRSALYMPASNARALEKARSLDADMLIIDLEDAVPHDLKADARAAAVQYAADGVAGKIIAIRANGADSVYHADDIAALAHSVLEGHTRGKRKGGLEIRFFETGTEEDKEFHDDKESTFYELNKPIHIYLTPERKVKVIKNPSNKRGLQVLEDK